MADHRIGQCEKCGRKDVEIAAHDLCFACYRKERRDIERGEASLNRAQHRQNTALISAYARLMLALATLDKAADGGSDLADWVKARIEPLTEKIHEYITHEPRITIERIPTAAKRYKAFHEIAVNSMKLGANKQMILEIQSRVISRLDQLAVKLPSKNFSSRSRPQ